MASTSTPSRTFRSMRSKWRPRPNTICAAYTSMIARPPPKADQLRLHHPADGELLRPLHRLHGELCRRWSPALAELLAMMSDAVPETPARGLPPSSSACAVVQIESRRRRRSPVMSTPSITHCPGPPFPARWPQSPGTATATSGCAWTFSSNIFRICFTCRNLQLRAAGDAVHQARC